MIHKERSDDKMSHQYRATSKSSKSEYIQLNLSYKNKQLVFGRGNHSVSNIFTNNDAETIPPYIIPCKKGLHDTINTYYWADDNNFTLLHGDSLQLLKQFDFKFDMVFADPPYFLSNGGISVQSGKVACVDKGEWDKCCSPDYIDSFNREWLGLCRDKLKENGTIWISGTYHNIFSIAKQLTELNYKILNVITWVKTNPPPNISCRYFTFSTEFIIWARKSAKKPHYYNYELMKRINGNKQMTDVWRIPAIARWEKSCGKHPTQKPLAVLARIILASTTKGAWILDPFTGSSTTGIAANLLGRRFLGIDKEDTFLSLSENRKHEIENIKKADEFRNKIKDVAFSEKIFHDILGESITDGYDLPF